MALCSFFYKATDSICKSYILSTLTSAQSLI